MTRSILETNSKLLIEFTNPHTSIICNHAYEALTHIADVVVIMKQSNVLLHCFCRRVPIVKRQYQLLDIR